MLVTRSPRASWSFWQRRLRALLSSANESSVTSIRAHQPSWFARQPSRSMSPLLKRKHRIATGARRCWCRRNKQTPSCSYGGYPSPAGHLDHEHVLRLVLQSSAEASIGSVLYRRRTDPVDYVSGVSMSGHVVGLGEGMGGRRQTRGTPRVSRTKRRGNGLRDTWRIAQASLLTWCACYLPVRHRRSRFAGAPWLGGSGAPLQDPSIRKPALPLWPGELPTLDLALTLVYLPEIIGSVGRLLGLGSWWIAPRMRLVDSTSCCTVVMFVRRSWRSSGRCSRLILVGRLPFEGYLIEWGTVALFRPQETLLYLNRPSLRSTRR